MSTVLVAWDSTAGLVSCIVSVGAAFTVLHSTAGALVAITGSGNLVILRQSASTGVAPVESRAGSALSSPDVGSVVVSILLLGHFHVPIKVSLVWERRGKAPCQLTLSRECFLKWPTLRTCLSFAGLDVRSDNPSAWLWCLPGRCTMVKSKGCRREIYWATIPSGSLKLRSHVRLAWPVTTVKCLPVR